MYCDAADLPVQVSNLTDVKAIAGGECEGLVLKSDGTVWTESVRVDGSTSGCRSAI